MIGVGPNLVFRFNVNPNLVYNMLGCFMDCNVNAGLGDRLKGYKDVKDFVQSLAKPRYALCGQDAFHK